MSDLLTPDLLSPAQRQAYRDIVTKKVMCITSDCGFGKSISMLNAFLIIKKKFPNTKALVVCTPQGVKKTWSVEHEKWSHTNHLKVIPLVGTPAKRLKLLQEDADIYAISYNSLEWLHKNNKGRNKINFNYVFADEGDCLKGASSKWRGNLIKAAPKAKYKIISTATPKTRSEDDYFGLCLYLDKGESLGTFTATSFRHKYCQSYVFRGRQIWSMRPDMVEELENRIRHLFINYEVSEKADIKIITKTLTVDLKPSSRAKYERLKNEQCINSIIYNEKGLKDHDKSLDAVALSNKLNQLTSGFLYVDEQLRITPELLMKATSASEIRKLMKNSTKKKSINIFNDRMVAFKKMIRTIHRIHGQEKNIVIPYFYKHELVQLQKILPESVDDTSKDFQNRWNAGEIKYLLLQYTRSSKSLNLQQGGHIMAMYCPTFKWVDDYQIVRRLARQGQLAEAVYVYRLYMKDTIDDLKTKRLDERFKGHSRFQASIMKKLK